jgi:hypothetical protein
MAKENANPESATDRGGIIAPGAAECARLPRGLTGRDIINALAGSPVADVPFERLSIRSKVRSGPKF